MLQKKMMLLIGAMAGAGLLGMIVMYLICGQIAGDYIGLGAIFSADGTIPESASPTLSEIESIRIKIFSGGVVGVIVGLIAPVLSSSKPMK